jgi:hypothetical protein
MGLACPWPPPHYLPPLPIKGSPWRRKIGCPLFHRRQPSAYARHCSTSVSRSSSAPLVDSVHPENPLELTVLLRLILQHKTHQIDCYTGSHHRRPPPTAHRWALSPMLLVAGKSLPNVLGILVQLGSQAKEIFFTFGVVSAVNAVGCHRPITAHRWDPTSWPPLLEFDVVACKPKMADRFPSKTLSFPSSLGQRWGHHPGHARRADLKATRGPVKLGLHPRSHCGYGLRVAQMNSTLLQFPLGLFQIQIEFGSNSLVFGLNSRIWSSCIWIWNPSSNSEFNL